MLARRTIAHERDLVERARIRRHDDTFRPAGSNRSKCSSNGRPGATIVFVQPDGTIVDRGAGTDEERPVVDATLVQATLALTPEARLLQNDRILRTIKELRDGFAARRADDPAGETGRGAR